MSRRTLFIVGGALILVLLLLASWFWLFSKGSSVTSGLFGSSGNKTGTTTAQTGQNTNIANGLPSGSTNAGSGNLAQGGGGSTNVPLGGGTVSGGTVGTTGSDGSVGQVGQLSGSGSGVGSVGDVGGVGGVGGVGTGVGQVGQVGSTGGSVGVGTVGGTGTVPGVDWLGGTGSGGTSGAPITTLTPSGINQLNDGQTGGSINITPSGSGNDSSNNSGLGLALGAAGIGAALCSVGLVGGLSGLGGTAAATAVDQVAVPVNARGVVFQQGVTNSIASSQAYKSTFLDCITRSIGRAIVDQITNSVVNWINGGFKGSPSFVQNYQQFFTNVADQAAGEFIKGSDLAFLCSPFQLQIKLAIAQSYASRNSAYGGNSCSLSQVSNNINGFLNGNFSAGGWPALLSVTSVPTNNPYGAYAYAQAGLATAQQTALTNAVRNISPGGFLNFVEAYNCNDASLNQASLKLTQTQAASGQCPKGCQCRTTTPGTVIQSTLVGTENSTLNQLNLAKSFDEILSALVTQLITKTLYQGLGSLSSGQSGYAGDYLTPDQQQAQSIGNALLVTLQGAQQTAQDYGTTQQGSIKDIQNTQQNYELASNCWETIYTSSSTYSEAQINDAKDAAAADQAAIASLEAQVGQYNNNITRANSAISALQSFQTRTLSVTSTADVATIQSDFNAALANGQLITTNDVTQAQQDRATLQSTLAAQNQAAADDLKACKAVVPAATDTTSP